MHMENIVLYIHITLLYCLYQNEVVMHVTSHGLVMYSALITKRCFSKFVICHNGVHQFIDFFGN